MRILLVNKFWWRKGGVEDHAFMLKRVFEERGHEVVPFAMADAANRPTTYDNYFPSQVEFRTGGVKQKASAAMRATLGWETIRNLRHLLDDVSIDAAHVLHAYHQLGTTFLRLLERRGIPT
ncbi:MAG TPA: glycosyltransferase, partial [Acidimicrobiales bacterium]